MVCGTASLAGSGYVAETGELALQSASGLRDQWIQITAGDEVGPFRADIGGFQQNIMRKLLLDAEIVLPGIVGLRVRLNSRDHQCVSRFRRKRNLLGIVAGIDERPVIGLTERAPTARNFAILCHSREYRWI